MMRRILIAATLCACSASPDGGSTDLPLTVRHELQDLLGVADGGGVTVAVGRKGTMYVAPSDRWLIPSTSVTSADLFAVTYGGGRFVAVGDRGTIIGSLDGKTWSAGPQATSESLRAVAYLGGRFVAAGSGGALLSSADGVVWSAQTSPFPAATWQALAAGDPGFLVMGVDASGGGVHATSADGHAWSGATDAMAARAVSWSQGFVAVGDHFAATSADGQTWSPPIALPFVAYAVGHGGKGWLAGGEGGHYAESTDGRTWTAHPPWVNADLYGFVQAGNFDEFIGPGGIIMYRVSEGTGWVWRLNLGGSLAAAAHGPMGWALVGSAGEIFFSRDAVSFEAIETPSEGLAAVVAGGGRFVAVGPMSIFFSDDGRVWHDASASLPADLRAIAYGAGRFVAAGESVIAASADGATWTPSQTVGARMEALAYLRGQFVAVGSPEAIYHSPDGVAWTEDQRGDESAPALTAIAANDHLVLAAGASGVWASTDATHWTARPAPPGAVTSLAAVGDRFVATVRMTSTDHLYTTRDGMSWAPAGDLERTGMRAVSDGEKLLVIGRRDAILSSP